VTDKKKLPQGWKWVKLGRMGKLTQGGTPSTDNAEYWNGDIPFITGADVTDLFVSGARSFLTAKGLESGKSQECEEGDLIIVSRTRVGRVGIAAVKLSVSQDVSVIKLENGYHNTYIALYLLSLSQYLQESSQGAVIKGLTRGFIENIEIPIPPTFEEQMRIAAELEEKRIVIEQLRQAVRRQLGAVEAMPAAAMREAFGFDMNAEATN